MSSTPSRNPERRGQTERAVEVSGDVPAKAMRWSASSVTTFEQCPLKLWWGKVAGWQEGPSVATAAGSAVHEALEELMGLDAPERTRATGEQALVTALDRGRDQMAAAQLAIDEVVAKSEAALSVYWEVEDPQTIEVIPGGIERELGPALGDVSFIGFADRVAFSDTGTRVTDYKTGVAKPQYFGPYYRQQYLYAGALELEDVIVTEIELLFLGDGRRVRRPVYPRALSRAVDDLQAASAGAQGMLEQGVWTARQSPLCGWCAFETVCPLRRSRAPIPGSAASDERLAEVPGMVRRAPVSAPAVDADAGEAFAQAALDEPELLL